MAKLIYYVNIIVFAGMMQIFSTVPSMAENHEEGWIFLRSAESFPVINKDAGFKKSRNQIDKALTKLRKDGHIKTISKNDKNVYLRLK